MWAGEVAQWLRETDWKKKKRSWLLFWGLWINSQRPKRQLPTVGSSSPRGSEPSCGLHGHCIHLVHIHAHKTPTYVIILIITIIIQYNNYNVVIISYYCYYLGFQDRVSLHSSLCRPEWPWKHTDLNASTSSVLGLNAYTVTTQLQNIIFKKIINSCYGHLWNIGFYVPSV